MKNKQKIWTRRTLLKMAAVGSGSLVVNACSSSEKKSDTTILHPPTKEPTPASPPPKVFRQPAPVNENDGPIDRTLGEVAPLQFSGETPDRSHQILWDVPGFINTLGGSVPEPTEKAPVVVVGGGMSGLFSAYRLKRYIPIVLEGAEKFGGNSRGESWRGIDYSIGAAYLTAPSEGSALDQLYKELDLYRRMKTAPNEEPVIFNGKMFRHFLRGDTHPTVETQGSILERYFTEVLENKNGRVYPELPPSNEAQMKAVKELDGVSFREHIKKVLKTDAIHPHLDTWLEHYCWSVFGSSSRELSAAVGVNQFAAEFGKIWVPPGGNAFVAEQLLNKLKKAVGVDRLRSRCMVFQVKVVDEGVWVSYERDGQVKTILAESVVMACPKFIVPKIFKDLEPEREKVIRRLRYNSYLVANVLLNQRVPEDLYDIYLLADGKVDGRDIQGTAERHRVTDVINGTYVKGESAKSGVLTLYRAFPYLGGRAQTYSTGAYFKYRKEFIEQIEKEILPALNIPAAAIAGLRMARWGHPLPVAMPGMIKDGSAEILHKPYKDKVYFVNQDNWLNPCLEGAFAEAQKWAPLLEKTLEERRLAKIKQSGSSSKPPSPAKSEGKPEAKPGAKPKKAQ